MKIIQETTFYENRDDDELAKQLVKMHSDADVLGAIELCYKLIKSEEDYIRQLETLVLSYAEPELKRLSKKMAPHIHKALMDGIEMDKIKELPTIKTHYDVVVEIQKTIKLIKQNRK